MQLLVGKRYPCKRVVSSKRTTPDLGSPTAKCTAALNESDPMDMLVKLYDLPKSCAVFERLGEQGIHIRRALAAEKHKIAAWVRENFAEGWASETEIPLAAR